MIVSRLIKPASVAATAFGILMLPGILAAQAPSRHDTARTSGSGNYLAARHAGAQRDAAAASAYYRAALRSDPRNPELLERAFIASLTEGDIDEAVRLAERTLKINKNDKTARLVLGIKALKSKQYPTARLNIAQSVRGPVTDLTAALLIAWTQYGSDNTKTALEVIDRLQGPDWYATFKDLHAGLILDAANKRREAGRRLEKVLKNDATALRIVEAYGSLLSREGKKDEALAVFDGFEKALPNHPLIADEVAKVKAGEKLPPLVQTPQAGAAEVLYGIGSALGRRGGEDLGLAYLQLALYLEPNHPLALLSLADLYEALKKPQEAIDVYRRVPASSPLHRNAEIQLATNLDSLEKTDEAKIHLKKLIEENPKDSEAIMALGNIERARKNYAECADTYSKAISLISNPQKSNWLVFYFRGICHERAKNWQAAEADLKKALELYPDQAHVLNYLGYSWVDQGINLDEGMRMIRRAVEQRPDDGYIVDSLGWAYYRTGNIEEATKYLERAVELKPEDPTINDHLGDAYWKTGRQLEARFQWQHAVALKPEPDELKKIEAKIKDGLPEETNPATAEQNIKRNGG